MRDVLNINERLSELFRAEMDKGRLVFSDVPKAPNSCSVSGRYVGDSEISLDIFVYRGQQQVHTETIQGSVENMSELLKQVAEIAIQKCPVQ